MSTPTLVTISELTLIKTLSDSALIEIEQNGVSNSTSMAQIKAHVDAYTKAQTDAKYPLKTASYTKAESDAKYPLKAASYTKAETYTKAESDAKFPLKAASYTKTESDAKYPLKAASYTKAETYTKAESDAKYPLKAASYTKAESNTRHGFLHTPMTASTGTMSVAAGQAFKLNAGSGRTVAFTNVPAGKALTVVVKVMGDGTVNWPAGTIWVDKVPVLKATYTYVSFLLMDGNITGHMVVSV